MTSPSASFIALLALGSLVLGGCASRPAGTASLRLPPPPPIKMRPPTDQPHAATPEPIFPWLVVNAFYPAGSKPILPPGGYRDPHLVDTPRAWFPSIAECTSAQGDRTLYHLGDATVAGLDYVVFVRQNAAQTTRAVFEIRKALEVLWSPDGSRVAITVMTGSNNAAVVLLRMNDLKPSDPIPTAEALRTYFTAYQIDAPQFVMALRWTSAGLLVLRARGREPQAPHTLFGYELLVDTDDPTLPGAVSFLRGYTKLPTPPNEE